MSEICFFNCPEPPVLAEVGGKGLSLILMTQKELPVPQGFVLTTHFFTDWMNQVKAFPEWEALLTLSREEWKNTCDAMKIKSRALRYTDRQKQLLNQHLEQWRNTPGCQLFAVRSSSPEEDLEGASFAGGYETILGVPLSGIEEAVKNCFASALDERVLLYKKEHGFNPEEPGIAVLIQEQVAAEKAGVAFSLNPLNNCYDECVVNANFGLGESVVAGTVTPDCFIVDKVSGAFLEKKCGQKELAVQLNPAGGTSRLPVSSSSYCLTDREVLRIVELVKVVENHYAKPVDIEWAYAGTGLYLLQARPVTGYIPLPDCMLTRPGAPRSLYYDHTLFDVHGALTVMGTELFGEMQTRLTGALMSGRDVFDARDGLFVTVAGRGYANFSNTIRMTGKKQAADSIRTSDTVGARMLDTLDLTAYIPRKLPRKLKGVFFGILKTNFSAYLKIKKKLKHPAEFHAYYVQEKEKIWKHLVQGEKAELPARVLLDECLNTIVPFITELTIPLFIAIDAAKTKIKRIFKNTGKETKEKLEYLYRGLPHNITIEMGLALFRLACYPEIGECKDEAEFTARLENKTFSTDFLSAWDEFITLYGFRCPGEVDIASPRYSEEPAGIFRQLRILSLSRETPQNPLSVYAQGSAQRQAAYNLLYGIARKKGKAAVFAAHYSLVEQFSGYRELPKYFMVKVLSLIRQHILQLAVRFSGDGRISHPGRVFDLTLADIDCGQANSGYDLEKAGINNAVFYNRIKHIRNFPRFIDSRGKILHPLPEPVKEGDLAGDPISAGIVRGKVKVLKDPDEKPVLPGEILVTHLTDPGWTPLFLNAGGIILEIGGVLQHGALVAREYAKPCIAGVINATTLLKDGQEIEMDGATGVIRFC